MNLASYIILAIVIGVLALAVKATFFKKSRGGCCDTGDERTRDKHPRDEGQGLDFGGLSCSAGCSSCSTCKGCASASNTLQAVYKSLE